MQNQTYIANTCLKFGLTINLCHMVSKYIINFYDQFLIDLEIALLATGKLFKALF